jgi:membrane protease YdiL (CAAX protease family)
MESLPQPPEEHSKQVGWVWTSWVVILLGVAAVIGVRHLPIAEPEDAKPNKLLELQARYIIGMHRLIGPLAPNLYEQAQQQFNRGNLDQRLSFVAIAGEMTGPMEALNKLDELADMLKKSDIRPTASQERTLTLLRRLYTDYAAGKYPSPAVTADDRAFLAERLGWFGELALQPPVRLPVALAESGPVAGAAIGAAGGRLPELAGRDDVLQPARVTAIAIFCAATVGIVAAVIGFFGALAFLIQSFMGGITWRFHRGSIHGGVYAETFALWLIWFFGLNLTLSLLPTPLPRLTNALIAMPTSLLALAWPIMRGVSFHQMRLDLGLMSDRNPFVEFAAGVWCYVINLPLVILGLAITIGLLKLQGVGAEPVDAGEGPPDFSNEPLPSHPIVHVLAGAHGTTILQIYLLASVFAPIVEETMFRGVLHRHCRELTGRWPNFWSALFSTTVVSFIFAAVHPQGLAVIPVLMFMAFGFSLAREWRGSLLPSMFAHGMSNGLVLTVAMFALSR